MVISCRNLLVDRQVSGVSSDQLLVTGSSGISVGYLGDEARGKAGGKFYRVYGLIAPLPTPQLINLVKQTLAITEEIVANH